jgi:hypothetical protein
VKGTTGLGSLVRLTRGEVDHARAMCPHVALYIVSEIRLARGARPHAARGTPRPWHPWIIDDGTMETPAFEYALPLRS